MSNSDTKQLSIGEVGTINGKMVLCVECPIVTDDEGLNEAAVCCIQCAFGVIHGIDCPPCTYKERSDKTDVFYPEITKGL